MGVYGEYNATIELKLKLYCNTPEPCKPTNLEIKGKTTDSRTPKLSQQSTLKLEHIDPLAPILKSFEAKSPSGV